MSKDRTVLVTGGSGFIGTIVCKLLAAKNFNVLNVDKRKSDIEGVTQYPFGIENKQVEGIIKLTQPDTIIHLAASHEVGRSVANPAEYFTNNVANTIALLNHAEENGVKNFIYSSSSNVYGLPEQIPTPESAHKNPLNPYGLTKSMCEDIIEQYTKAYNIKAVSLRYFNAAGADPDLSHGYTQDPASHLIPIIAKAAVSGEKIKVFGNDYPTADGTCRRDYTHVKDIARAHVNAIEYLDTASDNYKTINIGTGQNHSVLEVIKIFNQINSTSVEYDIEGRRQGDGAETCADITQSSNVLNWQPKFSINDICEHAYAWEVRNKRKK